MKFENLCTVNRICEEIGEEEKLAVQNAKEADKKMENLEKELEKTKIELEKAKKDGKDAQEEAKNKKELRRKAQKRSFFLTQDAMKEDGCDFGKNFRVFLWDYKLLEIPQKKKKTKDASTQEIEAKDEDEDEKESCRICFEKFGEMHPEAAIYPCGHMACYYCLSTLPQKQCPTCRAPFTQRKILKLYKN